MNKFISFARYWQGNRNSLGQLLYYLRCTVHVKPILQAQ